MASDVSSWLLSPENPVREVDGLDYERCAALHNHLVELGWLGSGRSLQDLDRRSWFDVHGSDADGAIQHLAPSLVEFLKRAYIIPVPSTGLRFFYWVDNLNDPRDLWDNHDPDMVDDEEDEYRFLTLYTVNENLADHGDGLNYDQKTYRAIMQMDILDEEITRREDDPPQWHPLEAVLSAWIRMVETGKITPSLKSFRPDNEKYEPWSNNRYSQQQVDEAVHAFAKLVTAISLRMENSSFEAIIDSPPLLDAQILTDAGVPIDSFAFAFCTQATRPPFFFIAPGLRVPEESTFSSGQVFVAVPPPTDTDSYLLVPPILLFRTANETQYTISDNERPFHQTVYHGIRTMPTGLYIPDANLRSPNIAEASGRLVLPFRIGEHEFVRKSDNARFNDGVSLYELGYPPFGGDELRPQRLAKIFESWTRMVESMTWGVDDRGVTGDVATFKDADTADGWEQYWIAPTW